MNVFFGWSKETSKKIALALRGWLPKVIHSIDPFISTDDIGLGTAWNQELSEALQNAHFGLLCVTEENLTAPWLIFEAGALSISTRKTANTPHVAPLLFHVDRSKVASPISQFQTLAFGRQEMWQLTLTLNKLCESCGGKAWGELDLKTMFDMWYPVLEKEINALLPPAHAPADIAVSTPETLSNASTGEDVKIYNFTRTHEPVPAAPRSAEAFPAPDPARDSGKQYGFPESPIPGMDAHAAPDSALDSFSMALDRLHATFGFIPDMARIYVQGKQFVERFQNGAPASERQKSLTALRALLDEDIRHMESDAGHGNPQRAERLELLKVLARALEQLP